jgi:hypothetical protein
MARFSTYAEVLTPDHIQWEVHARGLGCPGGPGLVLQEVLHRNSGRYQTTMPLPDRLREQARICAEVSGDQEMARIAGLSEVTISLEHLCGLDPGTRIVCGCELGDFTDAERARLPRDEGPADSARIIEGPSTRRTRGASFVHSPEAERPDDARLRLMPGPGRQSPLAAAPYWPLWSRPAWPKSVNSLSFGPAFGHVHITGLMNGLLGREARASAAAAEQPGLH